MIIDNLKARCVDHVALELARSVYRFTPGGKDFDIWLEVIRQQQPAAIEKINEMSNMELLDLLSEVFAQANIEAMS